MQTLEKRVPVASVIHGRKSKNPTLLQLFAANYNRVASAMPAMGETQ